MRDKDKTKEQLLREIRDLRIQLSDLEKTKQELQELEEALRESNETARAMLNATTDYAMLMDNQGTIIDVNISLADIYGMTKEEMIGVNFFELMPKEISEKRLKLHQETIETGKTKRYTERILGFAYDTTLYPVLDSKGKVTHSAIFMRDITESDRAAEELRRSELRFRALTENTSDVTIILDKEGIYKYISPSIEPILGISVEDIIGTPVGSLVHPDDAGRLKLSLSEIHEKPGAKLLIDKIKIVDKRGGIHYFQALITNLLRLEGVEGMVANCRDITEKMEAEEALRVSEERYRQLQENIPLALYRTTPEGKFVSWNPALLKMCGFNSAEELQKTSVSDMYPTPEARKEIVELLTKHKKVKANEVKLVRRDGTEFWVSMNTNVVLDEEGNAAYFDGVLEDISARKEALEALRNSEERFRTLIEQSPLAIEIMDPDLNIIKVNQAWRELWDVKLEDKDLAQRNLDDEQLEKLKVYPLIKRALKGEPVVLPELEYDPAKSGKAGRKRWVRSRVYPIKSLNGEITNLVLIHEDITEAKTAEEDRLKLEARFQEAQKMESLTLLAGGIAHDFNNLLAGILGNAELVLRMISPVSPARNSIEQIEKAAERAADLTRQMLAYSGKGKFTIEPFDLSELVSEMSRLVMTTISKKAILNLNLDKKLPPVKGDATQIRQLVMNLILNASDALEDDEGYITLKTGLRYCDEESFTNAVSGEKLIPGEYVYVQITDTGCGMDEDTISKIFDPFFSTKFIGRGLGLAATLGIVKGHDGAVKVESSPGAGTTFTVFLPAVEITAKKIIPKNSPEALGVGSGTILVIDDEEVVRNLVRDSMESAGYNVLTAADGMDGVARFDEFKDEISLILLDIAMPKMDGYETYSEIRKLKDDVPVVLVSGYSEQEVIKKFQGQGIAGFIGKPFKPLELVQKVGEFLQE